MIQYNFYSEYQELLKYTKTLNKKFITLKSRKTIDVYYLVLF
jgi:hypothetical protein